mmetsp:Transcript_28570/g.96199  ORF Transcript_28570/g.96199 Transcript_28570/m.96199 type:complete len:201 (+) Transcript_28570:1681-2283(+)
MRSLRSMGIQCSRDSDARTEGCTTLSFVDGSFDLDDEPSVSCLPSETWKSGAGRGSANAAVASRGKPNLSVRAFATFTAAPSASAAEPAASAQAAENPALAQPAAQPFGLVAAEAAVAPVAVAARRSFCVNVSVTGRRMRIEVSRTSSLTQTSTMVSSPLLAWRRRGRSRSCAVAYHASADGAARPDAAKSLSSAASVRS